MTTKKSKQEFIDSFIMREVQLHRAFEGSSIRVAKNVQEMRDKVIKKIEKTYGKMSVVEINRLNAEIASIIIDSYSVGIIPEVKDIANQVEINEVTWNTNLFEQFADQSQVKISKITNRAIAENAWYSDFQGMNFDQWFAGSSGATNKLVRSTLIDGYLNGLTTDQITKNVSSVLGRADRDVRMLTRSYLSATAIDARTEFYQQNDDLFLGYLWIATLDSRTTPHICGVRDHLKYDKEFNPVGHDLPWGAGPGKIHFGCRSNYLPRMRGVDFDTDRPAISAGKNYERGDNTTNSGKVRKSTKNARDKGIYKVEQVSGNTSYEKWLKRQPVDYVSDILGSQEKAQKFLSGRMTLKTFSKEATPINIEQL